MTSVRSGTAVVGDAESSAARDARAVPAETVDVSVLVPAKDEVENLAAFMQQADVALAGRPERYEVIVIDDGSTDGTAELLGELQRAYPYLHVATHRTQRGIADALRTGAAHARGEVFVFYPADLQFRPEDIPRLVAPVLAGESDIVTGEKIGNYDRAFVSRVYNGLSRQLFRVPVRDLNSVKAYRRQVMDSIPARPDWHRYMVVVAAAQGFTVSEIPVTLHPRAAGRSKFGIGRIPIGVLDMLSVWFELRFARKPLLLFGMLGAGLFLLGFLTGVVALVWRIVGGVGYRPLLNLVETSLIVGSVLFVGGLLGEMIAGQRAELRELRAKLQERETLPGAADFQK